MRKNKLTLLSLITMLSVSSLTLFGCGNEENKESVVENFNDSKVETIKDEIGQALPIGKRLANEGDGATETADTLKSDLGVLLTENDNSTYNIRYVAAFTGNNNLASAYFTRAAYTNSNGKSVAESTTKVSYVYTSINGSSNIKWANESSTDYTYYMVYTVRNIPSSDIFTALNVSLSVTTLGGDILTATQVANVYGIQGDVSKGVTYEEYPTVPGTYSAIRESTDITEAVVAPYYATFDGFVATKVGDVIALNVRGGSGTNGAFEYCSKLENITLPDTIQYIGRYAFSSDSSLKSMTFPRNLTTIEGYSSFGYNPSFKTLYYNALNLSLSTYVINCDLDTVYVSKDVQSLPNALINSSKTVGKVVYGGTTAEWNALMTDSNKGNGLFIDNVLCSDSKIVTVNYHLDGGTLDADTDTSDDLYTTEIISGHAITNPGKAKKSGKVFKGWYTTSDYTAEYDFTTIQNVEDDKDTKVVDLYAKFEDYPAGSDIDTALDLVANGTACSVTLTHDIQTYYFKITAPSDGKKDLYYLKASNVKFNGEDSSKDYSLKAYGSDKTTAYSTTYTYSPEKASSYKVYGSYTGSLTLLLEPGETIYIAATAGSSSTLSDENAEFSFDLSLTTKENDYEGDATVYTVGETLKSKADEKVQSIETMTFTATEDKTYCVQKILTGYFYGTVLVYHYDSTGSYVKDVELASTTIIGEMSAVSGTTYYIYCSTTNSEISDTKYMSVLIGDIPSNYKPTTATSLPLDGTETNIPSEGFNKRYYTITPTKAANYGLILNGGSSDYAKMIRVFKKDATDYSSDSNVLISATETGTKSSSYTWGSTSYGGSVEATVALEANVTYVVEFSYNTTSTVSAKDSNAYTFKAVERETGDLKTIAYDLTVSETDGTFADFAFDSKSTGKWFKYVAKTTGYVTLYVDGLSDGNTAKFTKYSGTSTSIDESQDGAMSAYISTTGTATYYFYVETTTAQTGLTLKSTAVDTTTLGDLSDLTVESETTARSVTLNSKANTLVYKFTSPSTDSLYTKFDFIASAGTVSFDWVISPVKAATDSGTAAASSDAVVGTKKLETGKEYYLVLKNIVMSDASATLTVTPSVTELPNDGSTAKLALSLDSDGTYTLTNNGTSRDTSDYWFKFECTESGTYKFYSESESTSTADPKIYGVYDGIDDATNSTSISSTDNDDHPGHSSNKYDYYVEVSLEAGHTYYFKMTPKVYSSYQVVVHVEKVAASSTDTAA